MRMITLCAIAVLTVLFSSTVLSSPQEGAGTDRPPRPPSSSRPMTHPLGLLKTPVMPARSFYKSKADWRRIIDSTWGPGLPLSQKLALFDDYAANLLSSFDGFLSLGLNWDSLRTHYRSRIDSTTSRGRFAAIMARFAMSLRDRHTLADDLAVTYSPLAPGVPVLVLSPYATAEHFGAVLTTLPDSSALVLRAIPNHPLALEAGDIVLGYEGVPWKRLVMELLDAELPVFSDGGIGARSAETHAMLRNVGNNWHLFETIDILKYSTKETLHLPVSPLLSLPPDHMMGNEQLDIPGIPSAYYFNNPFGSNVGRPVDYGKLPTADVGYIRLLSEAPGDFSPDSKFAEAVNALWETKGLIIDLRWNYGGWAFFDAAFGRMFSQRLSTIEDAYRSGSTTWSLAPSGDGNVFAIPGNPGSLFDRPIAVLLGPTCVSMGDITAQRLRYHPMVRFFGKSSAASLGDSKGLAGYTGWFLNYSVSDMFHTSQPGVYLNRSEFPIDEPVWFTVDGVAKGKDEVLERALTWITSLTYAHDVALDRTYSRPGLDSVRVTATLANPLHHAVTLAATVTDTGGGVRDSVVLYNDGLHGDGSAGDSVWGCRFRVPSDEGLFGVGVRTEDFTQGTFRRLPYAAGFATAGPLTVDSLVVTLSDDGSYIVKPYIKNNGGSFTVSGVSVTVICTDSSAEYVTPRTLALSLPIPPGGIASPNGVCFVYPSISFHGHFDLKFDVASNGYVYWHSPRLVVTGVKEKEALPVAYALDQNYPNPFNPVTVIEYTIGGTRGLGLGVSDVKLVVYDLLGREVAVLVKERKAPGSYEVKFDVSALASGVYLYRLTAGSFAQTRKMLVVK
jgi:hypothetical protein